MTGFMDYKLKKHDKPIPEGYKPPKMKLPKDLLNSKDVGIVFDEISGQSFLINYGLMLSIFQNPDDLRIKGYEDDILIYLKDETISPLILRRIFFRYPQNTEFIIGGILNRPEFDLKRDFDSLMEEFKPSFRGRRIYPQMMPMSERMVRVLRPEIYKGEENGSKIGRKDPCPCGSGKKYKKGYIIHPGDMKLSIAPNVLALPFAGL
jgi:hypothetical protein